MKQYIVTADYYDYDGIFISNQYWIIDNKHSFYKAKDPEDKTQELIPEIKSLANEDEDISRVDINVYELGNKITNKFEI